MSQVREIEKQKSGKVLVHLNHGESFPLYQKELDAYQIASGEEIPEEKEQEIFEELLPHRAQLRLLHLLQDRDYTELQLRQKLQSGSYPIAVIEKAITAIKDLHYIDDIRYAWSYMDARKQEHSFLQLKMELQRRGVSSEDIETAAEEVNFPSETDLVQYWAEKKHYDPETADETQKRKFTQFLLRRGFSPSAIRRL